MTTDNTQGMKKAREYRRLLMSILEGQPEKIITRLAYEYAESDDLKIGLEEGIKKIVLDAKEDAKRYYAHYQGGHGTPVLKKCPLGFKLAKGEFKPANEDC